jgi:D-alanyl-D-alanine carboxypeptidase (penicillin-binding protein 5/6)
MARFSLNLSLVLAALVAVSFDTKAAPKKKPRAAPEATPAPATPPPTAPGELPLFANGAIVIDGITGKTLYEKNADQTFFPASTTKIMTALLVIEAGDLEREVEVTDEDSKIGESGLDIKPYQRFPRRQMLYGLMLKSANDVAHALGRDNAGTMEAFALKMTVRAKELGAVNTSFRNPHGLHHIEHYTTARDLAVISRAAMQQPFFRQLVATRSYEWPADTGPRLLSNHNKLLGLFPGCIGVKTGFTNPAQHTLVTAALRGGREVISVVLSDTRQGKWDDCMLLMSYGLEHASAGEARTTAGN